MKAKDLAAILLLFPNHEVTVEYPSSKKGSTKKASIFVDQRDDQIIISPKGESA